MGLQDKIEDKNSSYRVIFSLDYTLIGFDIYRKDFLFCIYTAMITGEN